MSTDKQTVELGTLDEAAHDCLVALSGVDTHDVSLCYHNDAWAVIEAFAAKVQAAERERCARVCEWVASDLENAEEDAQAMSTGAQSCADQIRAGAKS